MLIGLASACHDMKELRARMAEKFGREGIQFTMYLPPSTRPAKRPNEGAGEKVQNEHSDEAQTLEMFDITNPGTDVN
jgi:hypothetical protein